MKFLKGKNYKKRLIIFLLVLIEFCALFLTYKTLINRNQVSTESVLNSKIKTFAMYIPGNNGYELVEEGSFPSQFHRLNTTKSGCIDDDGNALDDVELNYQNGEITVNTTKTVFCYLYFDFYITANELSFDNNNNEYTNCDNAQCAIDELYDVISRGTTNRLVAGLYRYQGLTSNNYICFGTTNLSDCVRYPDRYMYRIIGINFLGQIKLIKNEPLDIPYAWNTSNSKNWADSTLFNGLNGSYFLDNTNYIPNDNSWKNRIALVYWKYGDLTNTNAILDEIVMAEQGNNNGSVHAKIGLLYLHDYLYSTNDARLSWLRLSDSNNNNNQNSNVLYEWTMTRYGEMCDISPNYCQIWLLSNESNESGNLKVYSAASVTKALVRPVFYLNSDNTVASGTGTLANPYILR